MATAREIMTRDPECVNTDETLHAAAERLAQLKVGALPICGSDNRIKGMLTDRDIVVRGLADGKDAAAATAGDLAQGETVTIGADDSAQELIETMIQHGVKRLPVIDGSQLVGVVTIADAARALPNPDAAQLVQALSLE